MYYNTKEGIIDLSLRDLERLEGALNTLEHIELDITRQIHDNWVELMNLREFILYFHTL